MIQSTLLLYYFRSYSPNVLREILKSLLLFILTVLGKRPADALKTSRKDVRRVTSLGRSILNVSYKCIFIALFSGVFFHTICALNTKKLAAL